MSDDEEVNVTHAAVRFIIEKNRKDSVDIVQISNIKEFRKEAPVDCFDFVKKKIYYARQENGTPYTPMEIFAMGSESHFLIIYLMMLKELTNFSFIYMT